MVRIEVGKDEIFHPCFPGKPRSLKPGAVSPSLSRQVLLGSEHRIIYKIGRIADESRQPFIEAVLRRFRVCRHNDAPAALLEAIGYAALGVNQWTERDLQSTDLGPGLFQSPERLP